MTAFTGTAFGAGAFLGFFFSLLCEWLPFPIAAASNSVCEFAKGRSFHSNAQQEVGKFGSSRMGEDRHGRVLGPDGGPRGGQDERAARDPARRRSDRSFSYLGQPLPW